MRYLWLVLLCWMPGGVLVVDDFEAYPPGSLPLRWRYLADRTLLPVAVAPAGKVPFRIREEAGNRFLRVELKDTHARIIYPNDDSLNWSLERHPGLSWRWRALKLPPGAREDEKRKNDTGAAVYVTFGFNWLGIPRSIKYTYSSSLPVGTVVSYGNLKVMVVASAADTLGVWQTVRRNLVADYRALFGKSPPERPVSIALWSDADNTHGEAVADFDDIYLLEEE